MISNVFVLLMQGAVQPRPSALCSEHVPQCSNGVVEQHTWASIPHHLPHLFASVRLVAVDRTLLASAFLLAKLASVQSGVGICHQFLAFGTGVWPGMVSLAVDADHLLHSSFLSLDSGHDASLVKYLQHASQTARPYDGSV